MTDLLTAKELEGASIDNVAGLLLKKVLDVMATKPEDEALATQAADLLTTSDPVCVATAFQLHSVFHKDDSSKKLSLLLKKMNVERFRDAFLETVADTNILQALGIANLNVLAKKLRIVNTNVYARQHKFNLFVEEPEGYSKFLYAATHKLTSLEPIIGTFSLDGNRCLDILLNLLAYEIQQKRTDKLEYLTEAIQRLDTGKLPHLLGFMSRRKDDTDVVLVTIHLVRQNVIRMEEVWPYMSDDSVSWRTIVEQVYDEYVTLETNRTKRINRISLASQTREEDSADPSVNSIRAPLESLFAMKVILELRIHAYEKLPDADWSKLATLFPDTIGLAIVDHCADIMDKFMDAKESQDEAKLLLRIESPLRTICDAGCLKYRPEFFIRLCRLIKDPTIWQDLLKTVLLPSTSLFDPNPSIHLEMWEVLKKLNYEDRYNVYEYWKEDPDKAMWMLEMEALVLKDVRYSLRRLSKETVRDLSRAVAKCCFRNPIVVFTTILNQIESYDNLVGVMVDVCRFVSPLGLDVLGFCILQRLTAARRNRLKESGVHASQWLQSLESFTGTFYKRYPHVEFQGLVTYLRRRLEEGQVIELGMLQALLTTVGGFKFKDYSPIAGLTTAQLQGRAGSTVLQRETMAFGVVEGIDWKSAKQVRTVLQKDGTALLILLAQVQYQIIFGSGDDKPVKLIGNLVDNCKVVMSVLLDFLTNYRVDEKAIEDYANALPTFEELIGQYEVAPAIAWQMYRPIYREAVCGDSNGLESFIPTEKSRMFFKTLLPSRSWTHITVDLFEFFCSTSLYDIHCPTEVYDTELKRLERYIDRLGQKKSNPSGQQSGEEAAIEHAKKVVSDLKSDLEKQTNHAEDTLSSFKKRREKFFATDHVTREGAMVFFAHLIYPRCLQGPDDAMFCAYFMSQLNCNETKGFGTLYVYDCIIVTMSRSLFGLTEGEAACASILLNEVWNTISSCRFDEKEFEAEFAGKPGAIMGEEQEPISFEAYTKLYDKWHTDIAAACVGCLNSSEYIHLRNCLVVLSRMVDIYPTKPSIANKFLQKLEPLQDESNSMADIRAAARAYNMQILQARDNGAWKEEDDATTKARLAEVEAAAAERQKKAKQAMAQIQKDSEKITEEIGEWSSRDKNRGVRHEGDDRRPDSRRRNDERRNVRPIPPGGQHTDRWPRDRAPQGAVYPAGARDRDAAPVRGRAESTIRGRDEAPNRSHDVHPRPRGPADISSPARHDTGRKRSRPPSPMEQGEAREDSRAPSTKRPRNDMDEKQGEGDGGRRPRNKSNRRNHRRS